jgi:hypothetical protein
MDELLLSEGDHLGRWVESITGPLLSRLEDVSGGGWRLLRYPDRQFWPASNVQQERRKFLARTDGATWLVKFAGLGTCGWQKHALARQLHDAGFTPEVAGYHHGFLVERWHAEAPALDRHPIPRDRLVSRIGAYLGFRACHFPAEPHQGASLAELRDMARYNTKQALGEQTLSILDRVLPDIEGLNGAVRQVFTDNRMQPWEWLVIDDRLIKTDALDHSATHDLVGCQDITWDIAGAAVEFALSDRETQRLCAVVQEESGHPVSPALLAFMIPSYLAFQIGAHVMAADALAGSEEEARLRLATERYSTLLRDHLERQDQPGFDEEQDRVPAG